MDPKLPGRLDRATFDRVLQRAAELQAASKDIGEGLSEEEILALGVEVGIPAQHLQQALIEERTHITLPEPNGLLDRWFGPADFVAQRVVQGTPESIGASLTKWLERHELMVVQRGTAARMTYEPMETFARGLRRIGAAFDPKRAKPYLAEARLLTAVFTPLEAAFCHVALAVSLRGVRNGYVGGGAALGATGAVVGGTLVLIGAPLLIGVLPVLPMAVAGWLVARIFRGRAHRAQLGLERALDELERHPALPKERTAIPPAPPGVGRVIRDIAQEVRRSLGEP
jgi:hypothetical protein